MIAYGVQIVSYNPQPQFRKLLFFLLHIPPNRCFYCIFSKIFLRKFIDVCRSSEQSGQVTYLLAYTLVHNFINTVTQLLHVIASEQSERSNLKEGIATAAPRNDGPLFELNT